MSYSLRNKAGALTWNYLLKPLLHGKNPFAHPFASRKRKMSEGGTIISPKKMDMDYGTQSSVQMNSSDKSFDDDSVYQMKFECNFPRNHRCKSASLQKKLGISNKMAHLYDTDGVGSTGTEFNVTFGQSNYVDYGQLNLSRLEAYADDLSRFYVLGDTGNPNLNQAVYFHDYTSSYTFINSTSNSAQIEVTLFETRNDDERDPVTDTLQGTPYTSGMPTYAAKGYVGVDVTDVAAASRYPRVVVNDPDFHWSLNTTFCQNYKALKTRKIKLPPGGKLQTTLLHKIHQAISYSEIQQHGAQGIKLWKGQCFLLMRIQGSLSLGGTTGTLDAPPTWTAIRLPWYSRTHMSGSYITTYLAAVPQTCFGKQSIVAQNSAQHNWKDDTDEAVPSSSF